MRHLGLAAGLLAILWVSPARADVAVRGVVRLQEKVALDFREGDRVSAYETPDRVRHPIADSLAWRRMEFTALPRGPLLLHGERQGRPHRWTLHSGAAEFQLTDLSTASPRAPLLATLHAIVRGGQPLIPAQGEADDRATLALLAAHQALHGHRLEPALAAASEGVAIAQDPVLRASLLEAQAGARLFAGGEFAQVDAALAEAQSLLEQEAPDSPALASVLFRRSQGAGMHGDAANARRWADESIRVLRRQPGRSLQLANVLFAQSFALEMDDSEDNAVAISREMVQIARRLRAPPADLARYLALLSSDERRAGNLREAEAAARDAVQVAGMDHVPPTVLGGAWMALGDAQNLAGAANQAERSYLRALEATRDARDDANAAYFNFVALQSLGALARARGDLGSARRYLLEAVESRRSVPGPISLALALSALGAVEADRGDLDTAARLYEEAASIEEREGAQGRTHALTQLRLGELRMRNGEFGRADAAFAAAERFARKLDDDNPLHVTLLRQRAALDVARSDARSAVAHLDRALELAGRYSRAGLELASLQQARGAALIDLGKFDEAAAALSMARRWQRADAPDSIALARTEFLLARIEAQRGRAAPARKGFCHAADLVDRVRAPLTDDGYAQAQFRAQFGEIYQSCLEAWHREGNDVQALALLERFRGRGFLTALQARNLDTTRPELVPGRAAIRSLMANAPRDAVLLSFAVLPSRTLVFHVTPDGVRSIEVPIAGEKLEHEISTLRQLIARRDARDLFELGRRGAALYALLLQPALGPVPPRALWVSPDGPLHDLPFAALRSPGNGWLAESTSVTLIDSLGIEAAMRRPPSPVSGFVGVADALAAAALPALPAAREEVRHAAEAYPGKAQVLLGADATEAALRAAAPTASVLHLAVHATLEPRPLDSAFELTPSAADAASDGRLQLWEVLGQLRLHATLVVLSGCDTAAGKRFAGEGLFGFARAFRFAGAQRVVATLWPIQDRTTATLMDAFYAARLRGVDDSEALRQAMIQTMRAAALPPGAARGVGAVRPRSEASAPGDFAHPYYWAGFQIYGTAWQSPPP